MEFFVDNWIWFLIVGIVVLMTLIGYIAEKTDFGRKDIPKKEKTKKAKKIDKKEKRKEDTEVLEVETPKEENVPEVQISLATDSILENNQSLEQAPTMEEIPEELKVPFGDVTFDDFKIESNSNDIDSIQSPELNVDESVLQSPIEELKLDDVSTPSIELPDLNTIVDSEVEDDDDSDDVWKF